MTYGFIGLGNMAQSILRGMRKTWGEDGFSAYGFDRHPEKITASGVTPCGSAAQCAEAADVIVLAVKPQAVDAVLSALNSLPLGGKLIISMAAGLTTAYYEARCASRVPVVRVMPNINAAVGRSVTAVCGGTLALPEHIRTASELFSAVGSVYEIPERLFGAFSAIGCASPAYAYMFADALASAGVRAGLPRATAISVATDAILGSMENLRQGQVHPAELADRVCSPGGTTIEGVHRLRADGFESAVYDAIAAVIEKDKKLGGG